MQVNERKSSDRVILEKYFGRMCQLWMILSNKYHWKEHHYDKIFKPCLLLTNMNINRHTLRATDGDFYRAYKNRLLTIGGSIVERWKAVQAKYLRKVQRRLSITNRAVDEDETLTDDDAPLTQHKFQLQFGGPHYSWQCMSITQLFRFFKCFCFYILFW